LTISPEAQDEPGRHEQDHCDEDPTQQIYGVRHSSVTEQDAQWRDYDGT
jgi:hypothetical protein